MRKGPPAYRRCPGLLHPPGSTAVQNPAVVQGLLLLRLFDIRDKQLGDSLAVATVPILSRLD